MMSHPKRIAHVIPFPQKQVSHWGIKTVYYVGKAVVRVNSALHANTAVLRAVDHMQLNHYTATIVEVFDSDAGILHAVLKRSVSGDKVTIVYKRDVVEGM